MYQADLNYEHQGTTCRGFIAYDDSHQRPRPAVLVVHDWSGRNEFACQQATELAKQGYVGFAVDMYGNGKLGETTEEKQTLMMPLVEDRGFLIARLTAAFEQLRQVSEVDASRIGAIGFCFGGLCALDLARSGANVSAVVSLHGLLHAPEHLAPQAIQAKILVLHGYDDPMVEPAAVNAFCQEMSEREVDWQVYMYGGTKHAFTNPHAHDTNLGTIFNKRAAERAFQSTYQFLATSLA